MSEQDDRPHLQSVIFDLDGVVTDTAKVHTHAWKALFDDFLAQRAEKLKEPFREFTEEDYLSFVDGKPRFQGVKSFLSSRSIRIPFGDPSDPPDAETMCGLGNRKNEHFVNILRTEGVEVFESSVELIRELKARNIEVAIVTSSKNGKEVLTRTGLRDLFEVIIDGVVAAELMLRGKPQPDTFLEAAEQLGVDPAASVVVEDAVSGVRAGRAGGFGLVLGVDRGGNRESLSRGGAHVVVEDLGEITIPEMTSRVMEVVKGWSLNYDHFEPEQEGLREALCVLGNGYISTRGAAEESRAGDVHYPGTYLSGGYNRLPSDVAGRTIINEDLVNFPNWLPLTFRAEDRDWFVPSSADLVDYRQELDVRQGMLMRSLRFRDKQGRETSVETRRIVHMADPHIGAIEYSVQPHNWSGRVRVRSSLDGSVINSGVERYRSLSSKHLEVTDKGYFGEEGTYLIARTVQSGIEMAQAARTRVYESSQPLEGVEVQAVEEPEVVGQELAFDVAEGQRVTVEKVVGIYTSRDPAIADPLTAAQGAANRAERFEELLQSHARAWGELWRRADIDIDPPGEEQRILRMHIFHQLQSVSANSIDLDVGVPARGLHGEAYRGHIFWDELYIFPFYNLHLPEVTRSLLLYRYRRLDAARRLAASEGFRGAMFPWQSGSDGSEETQEVHLNPNTGKWGPDLSRRQRHVNLAIAYSVWLYYRATGERSFMQMYGAEMVLEIARFFASLCQFNEQTRRYEIHGVMGPDEYHEKYPDAEEPGLRNNAYTNVMTVWLLNRGLEVLERLGPERQRDVTTRIGLDSTELDRWRHIARRMTVPFHDGVISQFEGYEKLEEFDWEGYRKKYGNIARLDRILKAENDSTDRYKLAKQADTLMLYYLLSPKELRAIFDDLGYEWNEQMARKTLDYYGARTSHGSTLSKVVHASVMDRVDREEAWRLFREALQSDVADVQGGTTKEGVHLGAMSGTVNLVLRRYAGIDTSDEVLRVYPRLPPRIRGLRLRLRHRGHWYEVKIGNQRLELEVGSDSDGPVRLDVLGVDPKLKPGGRYECRLPSA